MSSASPSLPPAPELVSSASLSSLPLSGDATPTKVQREDAYDWGGDLGEGTFAVVRKATHKETGQVYAVKVIEKAFLKKNNKAKDVVFREREILHLLGAHPFVVSLHSTFQNADSLFFVMDYCANGELYSWLRKCGSFDLATSRRLLSEVVLALEFIHSKGVMHRDLKPENILLSADWHIKVIDFGTSKFVGKSRSGSFEGTPEYMSPELLISNEADVRTDLWALGILAFQLLTGKLPFKGETPWATMELVKTGEVAFPGNFPECAKALVAGLLQADPDKRLDYAKVKGDVFFEGVQWDAVVGAKVDAIVAPVAEDVSSAVSAMSSSGGSNLTSSTNSNNTTNTTTTTTNTINTTNTTTTPSSSSSSSNNSNSPSVSSPWAKYLRGGEEVLKSGLVFKKRRAFNVKKRQLLLLKNSNSNLGRLVYIDPLDGTMKGEVAMAEVVRCEVKSKSVFLIYTKDRVYQFEDKTRSASEWTDKIAQMQGGGK